MASDGDTADDPWNEEYWGENPDDHADGGARRKQQVRPHKPSDVELYERRRFYWFWPEGTLVSPELPPAATPEDQVADANLYDFFRLVSFHGGRCPYFQWHKEHEQPLVIITPTFKLTEGPNFPFGARWAMMQFHAWADRHQFLTMSDEEAADYFRKWRMTSSCPRHIAHQYLTENGRWARAGAGPIGKTASKATGPAVAAEQADADYEAKIADLVTKRDFQGAAALKEEYDLAAHDAQMRAWDEQERSSASQGSETEEGSTDDKPADDTRVLRLLYKGNMEESARQEHPSSSGPIEPNFLKTILKRLKTSNIKLK